MKRLFIGVPVTCPPAMDQVLAWQADPALNLNRLAWTKPSNWHFTLVFLGPTPGASVALLSQIIQKAFDQCPAYQSALTGVGVFPSRHRPLVLWLGLENIQPLLPYFEKMVELLLHNNFTFDSKPLKPHLTLARVKSIHNRASLDNLLDIHPNTPFGHVPINSITLYESISTPNGVVDKPLYVKKLKEEQGWESK